MKSLKKTLFVLVFPQLRKKNPVLYLALIIWMGAPSLLYGESNVTSDPAREIIIDASFTDLNMGDRVEFLEDPEKNFTITDVIKEPLASQFRKPARQTPNFGYSLSAYWIRFTMNNVMSQEVELYLKMDFPLLNSLSLFIPGERSFKEKKISNMLAYWNREVDNENYIFLVTQKPGEKTYYLRAASVDSAVYLPLSIWRERPLFSFITREKGIQGLFYGMLIIVLVYHFIVFLTIRDMSYACYVLFIVSMLMMMLSFDGLGYRYLWTGFPFFNKGYFHIFAVCFMIALFSKTFLNTAEKAPLLNSIMKGNIVLALSCYALYFFIPHRMSFVAVLITVVTMIVSLAASAVLLARGEKDARFYMLSWAFLLIGGATRGLMGMNVLPFPHMQEAMLKGTIVVQALTFSVALADRVNILRKNLAMKVEEEARSRGLISRQKEELEAANEELQATNEEFEAQNEELMRAQADLTKSEEIFRSIFELSPFVITINRAADGAYVLVNRAFEKHMGFTAAEAIGKTGFELGFYADDDSGRAYFDRIIKNGIVENANIRVKNKHGEYLDTLFSSKIVNFNNEASVLTLSIDITETKKLEEQLVQTQKMDIVGQLAGGIAHDFNNMLGGILGSSELLARKISGDEKLLKHVSIIRESALKASDLTAKLMFFSRQQTSDKKEMDVHEAIDLAISLLHSSIDRRIEIVTEFGASCYIIRGNATMLQNVFLNLGINARDAMPDGGRLIFRSSDTILDDAFCHNRFFELKPGPYVEIEVADTGTGIPRDVITRIFEPFFTTKAVGKGTGLGLSMVYGAVRDHGGAIHVYSEAGHGTVFKLYLPILDFSGSLAVDMEESLIKGSGRILLIDDETVIRETAGEMLETLGYEVMHAGTGEEGLDILDMDNERIVLVILDMIMPHMSGGETLRIIREKFPGMKVLVSSGFSRDLDNETMKGVEADGFIQKPYRLSSLSSAVARILGNA